MARRGPTRKKRSGEQLRGMVWRMPSEEKCGEAIDGIVSAVAAALPHQPLRGVLASHEENGVQYLVYLIGQEEEPYHFPIASRTAIIRQAGGVLCTDERVINRLKNKCYWAYRERHAKKQRQ